MSETTQKTDSDAKAKPRRLAGASTPVDAQYVAQSPTSPRSFKIIETLEYKLEQVLGFLYFVVAAILVFRFVLSLFGANQETAFVAFVYRLAEPLMRPFEGMFNAAGPGGVRIEFEVLIAMVVYALVLFGVVKILRIVFNR